MPLLDFTCGVDGVYRLPAWPSSTPTHYFFDVSHSDKNSKYVMRH